MDQFDVSSGELSIGGISIQRLIERAGQTPLYIYDRQLVTDRVRHLRCRLPKEILIHYAVKANPMSALVQHLVGLVDGFDVASVGEMKKVLDASMAAEKISIAGPGKTDKELRQAIAAGITINLESDNEMRRANQMGEELGITPRVAVRVNPDFNLKSSGMVMGGGPKQFGVDVDKVPSMLKELNTLGLEFLGFHIFWGSQNLNVGSIIQAHNSTFDLVLRLSDHVAGRISSLNIGGGFGIPYFPGNKPLNIEPIGENLDRLIRSLQADLPGVAVATELGRYIVGEAGVYVCRIIDIKESCGEKFFVTNGGMHHNLAASGNFGQIIRKNYPVAIVNRVPTNKTERVSVVGPLCTPLDLLADKMELSQSEIGDLVVVFQSGAYGHTASPDRFLSHPSAIELLV